MKPEIFTVEFFFLMAIIICICIYYDMYYDIYIYIIINRDLCCCLVF